MKLTIRGRTWYNGKENVMRFVLFKDGVPFREYSEEQLDLFLEVLKSYYRRLGEDDR